MEGNKISFGFKKVKKADKPLVEEQKDFIECVEEKSIKVVGGEKVTEKEPLIIPLKPNTLITAEKLKEIAAKVEASLEEPEEQKETKEDVKLEPVENESLDQMAIRELLQEAKKEVKVETQAMTVPIPAKTVIDGQKESTLEDYESVPIQDFGLAMLRGMGWTPQQEKANKYKQPQLRPKGLGLGADKVISEKQKKKTVNKDGKEEELAIIKNSYVKIVAGKHSGYYGKVISLDEDNGRVMVEITVKKETVSLSEFMLQPVTKAEFDKESKVINMYAYEDYKKREQSQNQKSSRNSPQVNDKSRKDSPKTSSNEASSSRYNERDDRRRDKSSNGKERRQDRRRDSSGSEERNKKRERYKRDSSSAERYDRKTDRVRRDISEDRKRIVKSKRDYSEDMSSKRKERSRRSSSEEKQNTGRNKDKSRSDSSESEDRSSSRIKTKSSNDRYSKKQKEKSKRDSSEESRSRKKKEKDRKRYSSNDSVSSLSDSERKKKHKNSRIPKYGSDSDSEVPKKDKRDIDKKRKGKKKKRDRDRSPNYRKHRK